MKTPKIVSLKKITGISRRLRAQGKKIVFTNGTFDILHLGHVMYLEKAKCLGDTLVIGVNTDRSVKTYKSPDRPLNREQDRARVLSALACVDYVVLFGDPTPLRLIKEVKPHFLVKGADWKKHEIAGAREVENDGGKVVRIALLRNRSTTRLIEKIQKACGS